MSAPGAILLQAARNFVAPIGLAGFFAGKRGSSGSAGRVSHVSSARRLRGSRRGRAHTGTNGLRKALILGCFGRAERARVRVVQQQSATLRADTYHWSVLRCGSSSEERENHSTSAAGCNSTRPQRCRRDVANRTPGEDLRKAKPMDAGDRAPGFRGPRSPYSLKTPILIGSAIAGAGAAC